MKIVKGIAIFSFLTLIFGSCFDPPEFPDRPEIEIAELAFYDTPSTDSLVVVLNFTDGNGDLGLSGDNLEYMSDPFHPVYFYQATGNGNMDSLVTVAGVTDRNETLDILVIPNPGAGKLVFPRTKKVAGYTSLPLYSCEHYRYLDARKLLIRASDIAVLDSYTRIVDTLFSSPTSVFYQIQDSLYYTHNTNHYNIEVDFMIKTGSTYTELDLRKAPNCLNYDARFPILSDDKSTALEGSLSYAMEAGDLKALLGAQNTFQLRIQVKDRARNRSNVAISEDFTLDKIRKN